MKNVFIVRAESRTYLTYPSFGGKNYNIFKVASPLATLGRRIISFSLLVTCYLLLVTSPASAQCQPTEVQTDLGCIPKDPAGFTSKLYSVGLGFIGGVAVLSIIYGAYLVLSSQGDPGKLQKGKSYIVYAIIGLVMAVGGYAFYTIIGKEVVKIPGF